MSTLYLHIGTPKTGSTAIQSFCRANRRALEKLGYSYPNVPGDGCGNGHFLRYAALRPDGMAETPEEERLWRRCMDAACRGFRRCPNVILSEEGIWLSASWRGLWQRLRREADERGFDVRVIVYLRRQDDFLASWWAQKVKSGRTECASLRWEEMRAQAERWLPLDYYDHLEGIAALFGRERIDVRIYDRSRFEGGDVRADFLAALCLSREAGFALGGRDINPSLSGNALEIKRMLNSRSELSPKALEEAQCVAVACSRQEGSDFSLYSREEAEALLARYAESNRRVAWDYLGTDAPLFEPLGELPPKWEADNPRMRDSLVRFLTLALSRGAAPIPWRKRLRRALSRCKRAALRLLP